MKSILKNIGGFMLFIVVIAGIALLGSLFFYGAAWVATHILPGLHLIVAITLAILLVALVPSLFYQPARYACGCGFVLWSYLIGLSVWLYCVLAVLQIWGLAAAVCGLLIMGVGVIPMAMGALLWHAEWAALIEIIVCLALTLGARFGGIFLICTCPRYE